MDRFGMFFGIVLRLDEPRA